MKARASKKTAPAVLAADLVASQMEPMDVLDNIIAGEGSSGFATLINTLKSGAAVRSGKMEEQLAALLSEQQATLRARYSDARGEECFAHCEAGFLLGVEVGRRLAGGAR